MGRDIIPDTMGELLKRCELREIADWLIDPANKVKTLVAIVADEDGKIYAFGSKGLGIVEGVGLIEIAKVYFIDCLPEPEDEDIEGGEKI